MLEGRESPHRQFNTGSISFKKEKVQSIKVRVLICCFSSLLTRTDLKEESVLIGYPIPIPGVSNKHISI